MDTDLHAHLYGYLTAFDLYELGQSRWKKHRERLRWYEYEYLQAWGRVPQWKNYWSSDNEHLLSQDFLFTSAGSFARFQACFNLMIAVLPAVSDASAVARRVLENIEKQKLLSHVELRMPLPPGVNDQQAATYLNELLREFAEVAGQTLTPSLAISLPRDHRYLKHQYSWIKKWQKSADPSLKKFLTGIDFCGAEEKWPPYEKRHFLGRVLQDNRDMKNALAILYHVGETYQTLSPHSSVRWVAESSALGVHRIGHATSLGIQPQLLPSCMCESYKEWRRHLLWLLQNGKDLAVHGYSFDRKLVIEELNQISHKQGFFEKVYDQKAKDDLKQLQKAVFSMLRENQTVIETCPTSNMMLGHLRALSEHPILRFIDEKVHLCIGSDDPGIFDTSLQKEKDKCIEAGVSHHDLRILEEKSKKMTSPLLAGRDL